MNVMDRQSLRHGLIGLAAVAILACVWLGWSWWSTKQGDFAQRSDARDAIVQAGTDGLTDLYTINHRHAGTDVDEWLAISTDQLHEELRDDRDMHVERAREQRTVASASVQQSAVSELDMEDGTAQMLAVVHVELANGDEEPSVRRSGVLTDLEQTDDGWKVSAVQEIQQ